MMSNHDPFSKKYLEKRISEIDFMISSGLVSSKTKSKLDMEKDFLSIYPIYN